MSHYGMGWAQRQKLGDPIAKAILHTMCYVMRDDQLLIWVGIPTLCEFTEYDDRTVRKAIQRLEEKGVLLDTGKKRNNVTVWRIPGYEQWLASLNESTPTNGRASETDRDALAQIAELAKEKSVKPGATIKPSQTGEGQNQAPPSLQSGPPINAGQALPNMGANLPPDQGIKSPKSDDQRASPTGSLVALDAKGNPFDERASFRRWWNYANGQILRMAPLYELAPFGTSEILLFPTRSNVLTQPRDVFSALRDELTKAAVEADRAKFPDHHRHEKAISAEIDGRVVRAMGDFKPKSRAEQEAA